MKTKKIFNAQEIASLIVSYLELQGYQTVNLVFITNKEGVKLEAEVEIIEDSEKA